MFFFPESFWDQDGNQMELETHNLEIGCSRAFSASILNFQGCRFLLGSHVADWSPLFKQIQPLVWRLFLYAWLIGWAVATIFSDYTLKLNRIYIACFLFWLPPPQWMYCGLPSIIPYHPSVCLHHFYHSYQMDKWWIFQGICMIYIYIHLYLHMHMNLLVHGRLGFDHFWSLRICFMCEPQWVPKLLSCWFT